MWRLLLLRLLTAGVVAGLLLFLAVLALSAVDGHGKGDALRAPEGGLLRGVVERYRAGEHSGREFAKRWGHETITWTFLGAAGGGLFLAFSGVLPWCRREFLDLPHR
ncbi:MAG: hypothetical protein JSR82_10860 [Verrucomicrobia bacterium]|nr:hypothetical protein [Verrucomicrobiota bacterium]